MVVRAGEGMAPRVVIMAASGTAGIGRGPRRDTGRGRGVQHSRSDAFSDAPRARARAAGGRTR